VKNQKRELESIINCLISGLHLLGISMTELKQYLSNKELNELVKPRTRKKAEAPVKAKRGRPKQVK
jgi:hypothetical protein